MGEGDRRNNYFSFVNIILSDTTHEHTQSDRHCTKYFISNFESKLGCCFQLTYEEAVDLEVK